MQSLKKEARLGHLKSVEGPGGSQEIEGRRMAYTEPANRGDICGKATLNEKS